MSGVTIYIDHFETHRAVSELGPTSVCFRKGSSVDNPSRIFNDPRVTRQVVIYTSLYRPYVDQGFDCNLESDEIWVLYLIGDTNSSLGLRQILNRRLFTVGVPHKETLIREVSTKKSIYSFNPVSPQTAVIVH